MCLLVAQGSLIGSLLCTSDFLHPRHYTAPCIMPNTQFFGNFSHGGRSYGRVLTWCGCQFPTVRRQCQILAPEKVAHTARLSVELNTHPNRQFPGLIVVHVPSSLHVWFRVTRRLCSPEGVGEPSLWVCSPAVVGISLHAGGHYSRGVGCNPPPPPPSVDTTKTRSDPQRVRMSSGERPIGGAKGKQSDTEALCQTPPPPW